MNIFGGVTYNKLKEVNAKENQNDENCWKVLRANNISLSNTLNFDEIKYIDKSVKVNEKQRLKSGDILICSGSGSKAHIGKVAFISKDLNYIFGGFMGVIRTHDESIHSKYLFYLLGSQAFNQYLQNNLNSTTINNLNSSLVNAFSIPIPPLEIQTKVVEILDKFESLSGDLTHGIPAEIQARKKQYEYYRNKLLSFKPSLLLSLPLLCNQNSNIEF